MAVTEGQRATWRQAGRVKRPGISAALSARGLRLALPSANVLSVPRRSSGGSQNESDSTLPFLPSPLLSRFLPLCLSLSPCVCQSPGRQVCVCVSLSLPPLPPQLSPLLNHLNHCVLVTRSRLSGSSNTPPGDNPESHTRLDASTVIPDPRPLLSGPQTLIWDSAS